jgi:uncharacterized protein (TIGR03435 family)
MKPIIVSASFAILVSSGAFGQNAEPLPSFEVASVKVAEPPKPDAQGRLFIMRGCSGGLLPRSTDPGTLTCNNTPLKSLLVTAYGLKNYQVEGPPWLDTDGYDITAKVAPGTTREQFNLMLQSLLAERFKVTVHRETKNMQVYVLSIGKGGPKLKEVDAATLEAAKAAAASPAAAPAPGRGGPMPPMPPMPPFAGYTLGFSTTNSAIAGATLMPLTDDWRATLGVDNGVLVTKVLPGTPAKDSGLHDGDVIISADGQTVASVRALSRIVGNAKANAVRLQVIRAGKPQVIVLRWQETAPDE